jgi:hypothetical protein
MAKHEWKRDADGEIYTVDREGWPYCQSLWCIKCGDIDCPLCNKAFENEECPNDQIDLLTREDLGDLQDQGGG